MSADELQALTDDVEVNGQRDPIVLFDDKVIDGWHRYQACRALALKPKLVELAVDEDPVAYVKSRNLHRRHLTGSQRAAAVVACSAWMPSNRPNKGEATSPLSNAQMAKDADVSTKTIKHAKAAQTAGLGEAVRNGRVSAERAAEIAKLPEEQRARAVEAPRPKSTAPTAQAAEEHGPSAEEIAEAERAQLDDVDRVRLLLESDDALAALDAKCAQQAAQIRILEQRVAGLIGEKNEAVKIAKKLQTKLAKFEKAAV